MAQLLTSFGFCWCRFSQFECIWLENNFPDEFDRMEFHAEIPHQLSLSWNFTTQCALKTQFFRDSGHFTKFAYL